MCEHDYITLTTLEYEDKVWARTSEDHESGGHSFCIRGCTKCKMLEYTTYERQHSNLDDWNELKIENYQSRNGRYYGIPYWSRLLLFSKD